MSLRLVMAALGRERAAEIVVGARRVRIEPDRALELPDRGSGRAFLVEDRAEVRPHLRRVRRHHDETAKDGRRLVELPASRQDPRKGMKRRPDAPARACAARRAWVSARPSSPA